MSELGRHGGETPENTAEPGNTSVEERAPAPDRPGTTADAVDEPRDLRARMAADDTFARLDHIRREQSTPNNDDSAAPTPREPDHRAERQHDVRPVAPAEDTPANSRNADLQARMAMDDTFARLDVFQSPRTAVEQPAENEVPKGSTEGEGGPGDDAGQVRSAPTVDQRDSESQNDRDGLANPQSMDPADQRDRTGLDATGEASRSQTTVEALGESGDDNRIDRPADPVPETQPQERIDAPADSPNESSRAMADPAQIENPHTPVQSTELETDRGVADGAEDPQGATVDPARANLEHLAVDEVASPLDRDSSELEALMDAAVRAEIEGTRLSNRDRPPRDGDVNYIVDDPADYANTLTDIDFVHDGTLWEIKSATGEHANINIDRWVSKHMLPKFDRYLAAREFLAGYEEAPIGCYFSSPGVAPDFKSAVESAGEKWRLAHPDATLKIRWRDEHHL